MTISEPGGARWSGGVQVSSAKAGGRSATWEGGSFIWALLAALTRILPSGRIVLAEANRGPCLSFL